MKHAGTRLPTRLPPPVGIEKTNASGAALVIHTLIADELLTCGNWHIAEVGRTKE